MHSWFASYSHRWDNRVVPSFITSKRDPVAKAFFHSDSHTLLMEQCLQSVITRPAHGQYIPLEGEEDGREGLERKIKVSRSSDVCFRRRYSQSAWTRLKAM